MKLHNIRQIILYVENMQSQVEFYRDRLGLDLAFPDKVDYSEEMWVTFNTGGCNLALHGGGKGNMGSDAPKFTFEVDTVEEVKSQLEEQGVKVGKTVEAYPGSFTCPVWDPEGNIFYIQNYP